MNYVYNLKVIYDILNEYKFDIFCKDKCNCNCEKHDECYEKHDECYEKDHKKTDYKDEQKCKSSKKEQCIEENILKKISSKFLAEDFYLNNDKCDYSVSLIEALKITLSSIQECSSCQNNYGYLLQIDKFKCILKNLENLLCQLKCLYTKDCDLLSKTLCILFKIIDLLASILSKINNLECLCKSPLCCKHDLIECMVCELEDEVNYLKKAVADLAYVVFDIASQEILNCTTCSVSECIKDNKRDYLKKYCKPYQYKD